MLILIFLSICYTIALIASGILSNYYHPMLIVSIRCLSSGAIIIFMQYIYEKSLNTNFMQYKYEYLMAISFGFLVPLILGATISNKLAIVDASVIATLEPVLIYMFAAIFLQQKLTNRKLLLLILGTGFAFLATIVESGFDRISLISWREPVAILMSIIFAIGWLSIQKLRKLEEPIGSIAGIGLILTGIISGLISLKIDSQKFIIEAKPIILFLVIIIFGDLIVTRIRGKISNQYSATLLSLISIFCPFVVAISEYLLKHTSYSYKFFLLIIPSLICFIAFYYEETKNSA